MSTSYRSYRFAKPTKHELSGIDYFSERDELVSLREYVYKSAIEGPQITEDTLSDMKKFIMDIKLVIAGGHISWINKLKAQFPNWMFIHPDSYKNVDGRMLEGKERVYFFTDYLNHVSYS